MANGLKRVSNVFRNVFDMDDGEVSAMRSAIQAAAEEADPVSIGSIKSKLSEFDDVELAALEDTPGGGLLIELARRVSDVREEIGGDDGDGEKKAAQLKSARRKAEKLLFRAREENKRDEHGLDLRGGGDYSQLLWNRARRMAQRVDDGLCSESFALTKLMQNDLQKEELAEALGQFFAAYEVACDHVGEFNKKARKADRRAREHEIVGRINFRDNQRRARIAGRDPSAMTEDVTRAIARMLPDIIRAVSAESERSPLRRPRRDGDDDVIEVEAGDEV